MLKRFLPTLLLFSLGLLPGSGQEAPKPDGIKPYESVITSEFKGQDGVFKVHRGKDKLYYEIPKAMLDKDFLLVTQTAKTKAGVGWGGDPIDERVVRWHRRENKILLLDIDYRLYADPSQPIRRAVEAANNPGILFAFPIEAAGKSDTVVIEVSRMFLSDTIELTPKYFLGAKVFDATRCFLESAHAFPENIEIESSLTLGRAPDMPAGPVVGAFVQSAMAPGTATVRMHYSMVRLPAQPMMPRLRDERVGYFYHRQLDYGKPKDRVEEQRFIARYRLEKKDPGAALSEPVKPITFYIDPATPAAYVPYVKKGVEDWQPAFEEAGFKQAIVAKEVPKNDPTWSLEDARYSVIRWVSSDVRNAYGPHISDPRSGEILVADVHMFHNIIDLLRTWYLTQVGPLDPRARTLPLPDDLMGELVEFVVAHEVGHSMGLPHNMKSSSTYPVEKVRDREWVRKMGHCPSIMDYCRFNYVAQPEDHIEVRDLIPRIGPYDKFSIRWGYKPIPGATTPEQEKTTLDAWAREQDKTPWLRCSTPGAWGLDPGDLMEAVGDADAVYATTCGVKNIRRVMDMLLNATSQYGESYADLGNMYVSLLGQWYTELYHVVPLIGGLNTHYKHGGQSGLIFETVPRQRQARALQFLLENAFKAPDWLLPRSILGRVQPQGALSRLAFVQRSLLVGLMESSRLRRLTEQATLEPRQAYPPDQFLADLRRGIFEEFYSPSAARAVHVGTTLRRRLQLIMVDNLADLTETSASQGDEAALARRELRTLLTDLQKAAPRAQTAVDQAHVAELIDKLRRLLDPRVPREKPSRPPFIMRLHNGHDHDCWHDYQKLPGEE